MQKERNWLIALRGERTQEEVAASVETHRAHYSHIENGTRTPSVELAKRIGKELNFDWTIFFNNECVDTTSNINSA